MKATELGVEIKLTDRCNQRCLHCMNNDSPAKGTDLPVARFLEGFSRWVTASKQSAVGRPGEVRITGGEPLLRVDAVLALARYCRDVAVPCGINTNATLLSRSVAAELQAAGLRTVKISLDAAEEGIYRKIRGDGALFQKALAGIEHAVQQGFHVILRFTLCAHNRDQLLPCFALARDFGVDKFQVKPLIPVGRASAAQAGLTSAQVSAALAELAAVAFPIAVPAVEVLCWPQTQSAGLGCRVCGSIDKIYVRTDMKIITCNYLPETSPIGDLREDSLVEVQARRLAGRVATIHSASVLAGCPQLGYFPK